MSVANLFDNGSKPYQNLNVNNILCNVITANSAIIEDFEVDNLSLSDLTINNDETQVLVLNSITNQVQKRTIPLDVGNIVFYGFSDLLNSTTSTLFQNKLTLTFTTPEISGPYKITFSSMFGTLGGTDQAELRFSTGINTETLMQKPSSVGLNANQTYNETFVLSLMANQEYIFTIDYRTITGQAQILKSRCLVQYIG